MLASEAPRSIRATTPALASRHLCGAAGKAGSGGTGGGAAGGGGSIPVSQTLSVVTAPLTGGGTVSANPAGISTCGAAGGVCGASYPVNQVVTLTATAQSGYKFSGWSGSCTGTSNSATVTMSQAKSCTATFTAQYALSVVPSPATGAGTVSSSPTGIVNCGAAGGTCSAIYDANQTVTLTAAVQPGYSFGGWTGSCSGSSTVTTVSVSQAKSCTATFIAQYILSLSVNGTGTVKMTPGPVSPCTGACTQKVADGQVVKLDAVAGYGYTFLGWTGDCSGTEPSVSVTMSKAKACAASFTSAWARWPMPNPPSLGLPNSASYNTSTAGVVLDNVTGLMWQRALDPETYTASEAEAYCANLTLAGFSDWRLPARVELFSIFDPTKSNPSIDTTAFPNTPSEVFVTASGHPQGGNGKFWVDFGWGGVGLGDPIFRARCMRVAAAPATIADGDNPPTRYTVNNGTVRDNKTKLVWQQSLELVASVPKTYTWTDASTARVARPGRVARHEHRVQVGRLPVADRGGFG